MLVSELSLNVLGQSGAVGDGAERGALGQVMGQMKPEVVFVRVLLPAEGAPEGLLSGVAGHVRLQRGLAVEGLVALGAAEGFLSGVSDHVHAQVAPAAEALLTDAAAEGPHARVHRHVVLQRGLPVEGAAADGAAEGPLSGVDLDVTLQQRVGGEHFVALGAGQTVQAGLAVLSDSGGNGAEDPSAGKRQRLGSERGVSGPSRAAVFVRFVEEAGAVVVADGLWPQVLWLCVRVLRRRLVLPLHSERQLWNTFTFVMCRPPAAVESRL